MSKNPLPKLKTLEYSCILPISKKEVVFRPYTVADEKMLAAISQSSKTDAKFFVENTIKIAQNNIVNDIDVRELPSVDVRYIMLKLRSKSVGEIIELTYNDKPFNLDIDKIYAKNLRDPKDYKIMLSDGETGVELKDLSFEEEIRIASKYKDQEQPIEMIFDMLFASIKSVFNNENMWLVGTDITINDVEEFIGGVTSTDSKQLFDFIQDMPLLAIDVEIDGKMQTVTNRDVDFLS